MKTGTHRRVRFDDLMAFAGTRSAKRKEGLNRLIRNPDEYMALASLTWPLPRTAAQRAPARCAGKGRYSRAPGKPTNQPELV